MAQNVSNISNTATGSGSSVSQSALVMQCSQDLFAGLSAANVQYLSAGISNFAGNGVLVRQR